MVRRYKNIYNKYNWDKLGISLDIIGGLPECVNAWIQHKDPQRIHQIQNELINVYKNDFAKHNGKVNSGRILLVFRSIVSQLAKPNEKFIYGCIKEGARAREFEEAIPSKVQRLIF